MSSKNLLLTLLGIFALVLFIAHPAAAMRKQGVAVKGKLLCGLVPVSSNTTKVRIVDIDTGTCLDYSGDRIPILEHFKDFCF